MLAQTLNIDNNFSSNNPVYLAVSGIFLNTQYQIQEREHTKQEHITIIYIQHPDCIFPHAKNQDGFFIFADAPDATSIKPAASTLVFSTNILA
jgi:hypothetical protein